MEHRYSKRFDMTFNAYVYCRDGLILSGKTRNISVDGSFIELFECWLNLNAYVEVRFLQDGHLCAPQKAIVVHISQEGVGLMFEEMSGSLMENVSQSTRQPSLFYV